MSQPIADLAAAVRNGDRAALARAITLVESTRADHRQQAQELLLSLSPAGDGSPRPDVGKALHVGITGVPGVGKSTVIEALGMYLIEQGHRVAVLVGVGEDLDVEREAVGRHLGHGAISPGARRGRPPRSRRPGRR